MTSYIISLTLLAASVAILRTLFRKNVSAKLVYVMWLAVVLRLCLPFDLILLDIPTPEHFLGDMLNTKLEETDAATEKTPTFVTPSTEQIGSITTGGIGENVLPETGGKPSVDMNTGALVSPVIPDAPSAVESRPIADNSVMEDLPSVSEPAYELPSLPETPEASVPARDSTVKLHVKQMAAVLWMVGSGVTLGVFCISWLVFKVKLLRSRRFYGTCGRTKVYVSDRITSPCAFGVIPRIYITPEAESSPHLSVILLHEKTHIAHFDHLWNMVRVAAVAAHWWNPVIWLCAVLSKRDAELACDEDVTKQLDTKERLEYAKLIVDMIPVKKNCAVSFAGGPIKERIMKLTKEHKNKIIIAVVAVLLVACSLVIAFIGAKDDSADIPATSDTATETPETTEDVETTEAPESSAEPDTEPTPVYGSFKVLEATEENISSFEALKEYDVSSSEYSFSLILVSETDVTDLNITRLTWNEELLVEGEEIIEEIGEVKAGEAILLTTDSVEIIGYTGISYTKDGETARFYPATSGMDGSAILVEIGREMLSVGMLYPDIATFEVTVSEEKSLSTALGFLQNSGYGEAHAKFEYIGKKAVAVYGLTTPVYFEMGERWNVKSISAYGNTVYPTDCDANYPNTFSIADYDGALVFSNNHGVYTESWIITCEGTESLTAEDGIATALWANDDGTLSYRRYTVEFNRPAISVGALVLDIATSRDELVSETGKARFEDGRLILEEAEETKKIGELYDLDAVFENHRDYFFGYDSADEVLERNRRRKAGEESTLVDPAVMPSDRHIGTWSDGSDAENTLIVTAVSADKVSFKAYWFYYNFSIEGDALLQNGEWVFSGNALYGSLMGNVTARLAFTENAVSVVFDSVGSFKRNGLSEGKETVLDIYSYRSEEGKVASGLVKRCTTISTLDTNELFGYYKLICVANEEAYTIAPDVTLCNGNCQDSVSGSYEILGEYGAADGWVYPVTVCRRTISGITYESHPDVYNDMMSTAMYIFHISDGMHFKLNIKLTDTTSGLVGNEQTRLDNIARCCYFEYSLLDGKTGEVGYTSGIKTAEVSSDHLEKAETDVRYKWITSFIGKDIEGCAEVIADGWPEIDYYKELMAPLEKLEFGSYRVVDIEDEDPASTDRLIFEFTVIRSDYDVYPVGFYKVNINKNLIHNFALAFIEKPKTESLSRLDDEVISKAANDLKPVTTLFDNAYNVNYPEDPYGDEKGWLAMSEHLVHTYVDAKNGKYPQTYGDGEYVTLAEVIYRIYAMIGGKYTLHKSSYILTPDGDYTTVGHGGTMMLREIVGYSDNITAVVNGSAEIFYVDVRYYSDGARFSEAFTVRYTFDRVASVYGLVLHGIEKINDNGYTACGYTS